MADDTGLIPIQQSIPSDLQDKVTAISDLCSKTAGPPDALDDNKKRWLVVGICLHSVISPTLRTYIVPVLTRLYNLLVVSDNIDKQTYNTHLKCYKPTKTILNYAAINTNIDKFRRNDKQYDYRVYNAADLSKLFLQTHMAKYTAIDDSCDSSALLGIIINIDKFLPSLRSTAQDARLIIRNPWAHCDFTEWDSIKFLSCFKLMEQIIKDLQLNASDELSVLGDLSKWEKSGISFLSGTPLGLELVYEIREQTRSLAEYAQTVAASADDNFAKIQIELVKMTKTFDDRITYIERELEKKAKDDKLMQDRLLNLEENNTLLENELKRLDQETIPKHKRAQHEDNIKQWQEDDKKFCVTRATEHVISKICSSNIAVVTGCSGSGKSFLIHHVALHLHSIDEYEIIPSSFVTAPSDIINYRNKNRNQVFVIDDICGKHNFNLQIVQTWKDLTGQVEEIFKDNVIESKNTAVRTDKTKFAKLLISCRLEVFKDKRFQRLYCFTKHECNILSDSLCLLPEERLLMIKQYLPNDRIKEVNDILNEFNFFPLLCRLSTNRSSKELRNLFLSPIATIRADLEEILQTENKFKQCALVLCLIFEEGFDEQWLKFKLVPNDIQTKIKRIGEQFDINLDLEILRLSLQCAFCSLTGSYLRKRGTIYEFYHDKLYDIAVVVLGQHFTECLIKYASVLFISNRYVLESVGATNNDSLVMISEDMEESYFRRLLRDLKMKHVNSTLHNKQLENESFRMKLIKFFERNIEEMTTIFNQLDESGIETIVDDDNDDYDNYFIKRDKEIQISTPLIESIREGYADIIEFLIEIGCNINVLDSNKRSPLYIACKLGFTNVVKQLLNHHCDVSMDSFSLYCPMKIACANGYLDIVKLLIDNKVDVRNMFCFKETVLVNACRGGNLEIVNLLLQHGACVHDCDTCNHHYPPLAVACEKGYKDIVCLLLEKKSDINQQMGAPLFLACQNGHTDIVELLLVNNAYITTSTLNMACKKGNIAIVNSVLQNKTTCLFNEDELSPLYLAAGNGHLKIVEIILNSDIIIPHFDKWCSSYVAARQGHIDIAKVLIDNDTDVDFCDTNGYSLMYAACQGGSIEIVEFLIQQNVNLFNTDKSGWSLLHAACNIFWPKEDHLSVINLLLDKNLEISLTDNDGYTPLHLAALGDSVDIVSLLLKRGADVNQRTEQGFTSLHNACKWNDSIFLKGNDNIISSCNSNGKSFDVDISIFTKPFPFPFKYDSVEIHRSIVHLLLKQQVDISLRDYKEQTPLHIACESGDFYVVELLLKRKADITVCDNEGNSPLDLACQREHTDVVKLLLKSIPDISQLDNDGKTALHSVCMGYGRRKKTDCVSRYCNHSMCYHVDSATHKAIIEILLNKNVDVDKRNKHGETPLHLACEFGHVDIVTILLRKGADISICERDGNSLLHAACKNTRLLQTQWLERFERVFKTLVHNNLDINLRNNCQLTPLHLATLGGHFGLVKILIKLNADVNVCDNNGQSPLYLACEMKHIDIVKILLSHNADIDLVDNNKRSPLHAAFNGLSVLSTETETENVRNLVSLLIDYNEDLSHPDNEGKIPLHFACKSGCLAIVESLAVKKAHFTVCDSNGQTPLDEAKNAGHWDIVRFLENFEDDTRKKINLFYFLW